MKKIMGNPLALVLTAAAVLCVIAISICVKDNEPLKADEITTVSISETAASASAAVPTIASALPDTVTLEEAEQIALSHAGADSASAVFTKEKLDKGVYELKFSDIYGKYEYKIAANGTILDFQWDVKELRSAISLELAKEVALNHAKANGDTAVFTKEKLDDAIYKLKFSDENGKYEYEISAVDGTILDYKWDVQTPAASTLDVAEDDPAWEGNISREEACQIALDAANMSRETLKYLVCYISWTNHTPIAYEVKFATRWTTYHYTIDLDTGAVLGSVCHPHHG